MKKAKSRKEGKFLGGFGFGKPPTPPAPEFASHPPARAAHPRSSREGGAAHAPGSVEGEGEGEGATPLAHGKGRKGISRGGKREKVGGG